jgi:hypothetical protein
MSAIYPKQTITAVEESVLREQFDIKTEAEVDRYTYATKLGTLSHIDYAIPLFGYAREANRKPEDIYEQLSDSLTKTLKCDTEFVNGYLNIMLDNTVLKEALESQLSSGKPENTQARHGSMLVNSSHDASTRLASKIVQQSLHYVGINIDLLHPFPEHRTSTNQYIVEDSGHIREQLLDIPGVIAEADSSAMYLKIGDEVHALCSAKGGWYMSALIIATVKQVEDTENVFVLGSGEINQLLRSIFPNLHCFDTDVHAKHLGDTDIESIEKLITAAKQQFRDININELDTKQRQALVYAIDFEYEITEAFKLRDLRRILGEVTTLVRQHPVTNIT